MLTSRALLHLCLKVSCIVFVPLVSPNQTDNVNWRSFIGRPNKSHPKLTELEREKSRVMFDSVTFVSFLFIIIQTVTHRLKQCFCWFHCGILLTCQNNNFPVTPLQRTAKQPNMHEIKLTVKINIKRRTHQFLREFVSVFRNALIVQQIIMHPQREECTWAKREKHLKTLLFGPPFDKQVFVEQASRLMPNSSISSTYWLHASRMLQLTDAWIRHGYKTEHQTCDHAI